MDLIGIILGIIGVIVVVGILVNALLARKGMNDFKEIWNKED